MKLKLTILAVFVLALCAVCLAQTGISIDASTSAVAIHKNASWSAANITTLSTPVWLSGADSTGYKNIVSFGADAFVPDSSQGFTYYGVGGAIAPRKFLAKAFSWSAIPQDSIQFSLHGSVGEYVPSASGKSPRVSGLAGAKMQVALNKSGTVAWQAFDFGWTNPGVLYASSGFSFTNVFGATASSASAEMRHPKLSRAAQRARKEAEQIVAGMK